MGEFYILDDKRNTVAVNDVLTWGKWFEENFNRRIVAHDHPRENMLVSTVFLGIDHSFGEGPPLLFETMVFSDTTKGFIESEMDRYSTWEEAEAGHKAMLEKVLEEIANDEGETA